MIVSHPKASIKFVSLEDSNIEKRKNVVEVVIILWALTQSDKEMLR
jgi:hypothetical protein